MALVWTGRSPWRPPTGRRRRASPHRAAAVTARTATYPAAPRKWPQWITRVALILLDQTSSRSELYNASLPNPGELAATEPCSGGRRRRPHAQIGPGRPIHNGRTRLDLDPIESEPSDRDPTAESHPYRFALATLLKSPRAFGISTRRPSQVKNNNSLTPALSSFRTRGPSPAVLRVRP